MLCVHQNVTSNYLVFSCLVVLGFVFFFVIGALLHNFKGLVKTLRAQRISQW